MATKIEERYAKTNEKLEALRQKSRTARRKLIDAIMCDEKDVLSPSEIKEIEKELACFVKIQKQLGRAWFQDSGAFASVLWKVGDQPINDFSD